MPNTILDRFRISERVFAIAPIGRSVTFQSQQLRAFNLVWALHSANLIKPGAKVAVVGGGLAGITAATAAYFKHCRISIFERLGEPMSCQRKNQTRYIHPNMHRWPYGPLDERTGMPALNWNSASAGVVVDQIHKEWKKICDEAGDKIAQYFRYDVELVQTGLKPKLRAQLRKQASGIHPEIIFQEFDVLILTVGFGIERVLTEVPFVSYWENDSFEQAKRDSEEHHRVLISGCGDGGLIDAQRFCIQDYNHERIVKELLYHDDYSTLRADVAKIEDRLSHIRDDESFQLEAFRSYEELSAANNAGWQKFFGTLPTPGLLQTNIRDDVAVTLNSDSMTPLPRNSSALNRFIVYALIAKRALRYQQGKIQVTLNKGKFDVSFGNGQRYQYDQLIVRHGPEGALSTLVGKEEINHLKKIWNETVGDPTVEQQWLDEFYPASVGLVAPPTLEQAMQSFPAAFQKLYNPETVRSLCVGTHRGREGYIVHLKSGATTPVGETYYGEIPIFYRGGISSGSQEVSSFEPQTRKIEIGSGIYNASQFIQQSDSPAKPDSATSGTHGRYVGTLGMFVTINDHNDHGERKLGILTTTMALARNPRPGSEFRTAWICDPIGSETLGSADVFAKYLRGSEVEMIKSKTDLHSAPKRVDSTLTPDFAVGVVDMDVPTTRTYFDVTSPFTEAKISDLVYPTHVGVPRIGDTVYKIGRTTGVTLGTVINTDATVEVVYSDRSNPVLFTKVLVIKPKTSRSSTSQDIGRSSGVFSAPGDSGSVLFRPDGAAVGLLFAENGSVSYAFDLQSVLAAANCEANFDVAAIDM